jgi:hypothetical protein
MYEGFSTVGSLVSRYEGFANVTAQENAKCLGDVSIGDQTFGQFVNTCLQSNNNNTRLNTIFKSLESQFIDAWVQSRAEFGNLMNTYKGINTFKQNTNSTTTDADATITTLTKKKEDLSEELKRYKSEADAKNQSFLDSILQGTPKETLSPTLQDATLLLFWFGWILLGVALIFVRWMSPGGGWKSGLFATLLLLLVTLCLYAVLQQVA